MSGVKRAVRGVACALVATACSGAEGPSCPSGELVAVPVIQALYAQSDGAPLAPWPTLADRNLVASAGMAIGPGGADSQSFAADRGAQATVDALRIVVRTPAGAAVASGGPIPWMVYWSDDAIQWMPVAAPGSGFLVAESAYEIGFVAASARFFKAVNSGLNTTESVVTELQALRRCP